MHQHLALLFVTGFLCGVVLTYEPPRACSTPETSHFPFCDTSLSVDTRVKDLISRLNVEEIPALLTARMSPYGNVSRLGLPSYDWGANCVHGVQSTCGTRCATSFTPPCALGASWNITNVLVMGNIIGVELRALYLEGVREAGSNRPRIGLDCWSPNININRDPRWGRNQEVPSEDPYIAGLYAIAYTKGIQQGSDPKYLMGVSTLKHWAAYSVDDYKGVTRYDYNAIVSASDLAATYLPAFKAGVIQGGAKGIMCSYNSLNGIPTCASDFLKNILRNEWKYDGYVTSDTDAVNNIYSTHHYVATAAEASGLAIKAGTDINSGNTYLHNLIPALNQSLVTLPDIQSALYNSLKIRFDLGLFDPIENQPYWKIPPSAVNTPASREANLFATQQSLVLLKNDKHLLPLSLGSNVAVIGPHANSSGDLLANYLGQICPKSLSDFSCVVTPVKAIHNINKGGKVNFAQGCTVTGTSTSGFQEAIDAVKNSDYVIMFLGLNQEVEREAHDRVDIGLPGVQFEFSKTILALGKPTIVVLINGGTISAEYEKEHAGAMIEAFYPGFYGATAIAQTLFGLYNPGGKLPVTIYDTSFVNQSNFLSMSMTEAPGRGYRYFTGEPVYPFGWGLSYTTFKLEWSQNFSSNYDALDGSVIAGNGESVIQYTVVVTNNGTRDGDEVVQAYWYPPKQETKGSDVPLIKQLFAFQRVHLKPKENITLKFDFNGLTAKMAKNNGDLVVNPGVYMIQITNGVDLHLYSNIALKGNEPALAERFPLGL